jgi:hypothetical protein
MSHITVTKIEVLVRYSAIRTKEMINNQSELVFWDLLTFAFSNDYVIYNWLGMLTGSKIVAQLHGIHLDPVLVIHWPVI